MLQKLSSVKIFKTKLASVKIAWLKELRKI